MIAEVVEKSPDCCVTISSFGTHYTPHTSHALPTQKIVFYYDYVM